jgi:exopolysaccharide biosynthesis polyprenyl glycosylphosphotransferase
MTSAVRQLLQPEEPAEPSLPPTPAEAPHTRALAVKAGLDRLLAALALLLLAPLLLLVAVLIRLDSPGPVLYRQRRHGRNLEEFRIVKFRTMHVGPEGEGELLQARPRDPRVTRVGRWLRRASIDELPQLLNVLEGSMSLVGPRPHPVCFVDRYGPRLAGYTLRHAIKPGMTGLAQVHGCRGETRTLEEMAQRVRYDLHYIETWSLRRDLLILMRTVSPTVWHNDNAY